MEFLYAVAINGTMLYVKGDLSEQECIAVEIIAKQFQHTSGNPIDCEGVCQAFLEAVKASLQISLVQVPLQNVFRIKSQRSYPVKL